MKILYWILIIGGLILIFLGVISGQSGNSGNSWSEAFSHVDWAITGCGIAAEMTGVFLRKSLKD